MDTLDIFDEPEITEQEIDKFIAQESKYHEGGLTRAKALQFLRQREAAARCAPPPRVDVKTLQYEDRYGNLRWLDTGYLVGR